MWLWMWHRPAAIALIRSLAWEPPCAVGVAKKSKKEEEEVILGKFRTGVEKQD